MLEEHGKGLMLTEDMIEEYGRVLRLEEYSGATIEKYLRDIKAFYRFLSEPKVLTKENMIAYKQSIEKSYAVRSANSMLVGINRFLKYWGQDACCVKLFRLQRTIYCDRDKEMTREEYIRLVNEASNKGDQRLAMIMQTICCTGIRISELKYIETSSLKKGCVRVSCKGKVRTIFLPAQLCQALSLYCKKKRIQKGSIFVTKSGKSINRSNIWRSMKKLCEGCGISPKKVFPHNLRHLFAITFYNMEKDIVRLADILGHASVETTRIYTVSSGRDQKRILSRMNLFCLDNMETT